MFFLQWLKAHHLSHNPYLLVLIPNHAHYQYPIVLIITVSQCPFLHFPSLPLHDVTLYTISQMNSPMPYIQSFLCINPFQLKGKYIIIIWYFILKHQVPRLNAPLRTLIFQSDLVILECALAPRSMLEPTFNYLTTSVQNLS